jgi:hypothetical protein
MAKASIRLVETSAQIQKKVERALRSEINKVLATSAKSIEAKVRPIIQGALTNSPEIQSLNGGTLAADFGLTSNPGNQIVSAVVASLNVRAERGKGKILGGIVVELQPTDFSNLLGLSVAEQQIDGGAIPWLYWLLTQGDTIIIANYGVEYGQFGRTNEARMSEKFAPFKVDSNFSGTTENNFITRAVDKVSKQIRQAIQGSI